jgi:hypothetical protein
MTIFAIDNLNADTAEVILAVAFVLGLLAAVVYVLGNRRPAHPDDHGHPVAVAPWAPVLLSLAVAAIALAWWVL